MTPERQRIRIAEACGWKSPTHEDAIALVKDWPFSKNRKLWWINPAGEPKWLSDVPDYLSDLNAMHEAEKVIGPKQKPYYCSELWDLTVTPNSNHEWKMCHATAAQRAEAFLRTLNLWKDS